VILLLFGRRFGRFSGWLASGLLSASFVLGVIALFGMLGQGGDARSAAVHVWSWIPINDFAAPIKAYNAGVDFLMDPLALVMVLVVTGVGSLIHYYSIGYMKGDPGFHRYFAYLNLFAASMLLLVLANNLLLLYVGWEGVGLCSYLLIGFWFDRPSAAAAAKKAFLVNRIGDFAFLIGIIVLVTSLGTLSIPQMNSVVSNGMSGGLATVAALLLFAGATAKSAQIPLYVWLLDAMEGPTPVSALIHAATMVTAGVYLIARTHPVFEFGAASLDVVLWIGIATALLAAILGCFEYDIKRVLAYSTVSQIGYMIVADGLSSYSTGIFHLMMHAFFKALLFLGAGSVMHALSDELDMRKMGGLRKAMPVTAWTFLIASLAISGIFPLAGFWSKDAILASAWAQGQYGIWALGLFTAGLTAFYIFRLYFRVFEGESRVDESIHPHESPSIMTIPLIVLGVLSVIGGIVNLPGSLGLEHFLDPVLGAAPGPGGLADALLSVVAVIVGVAGIAGAYALYLHEHGHRRRAEVGRRLGPVVTAARNKFYVDDFYGWAFVAPGKRVALWFRDTIDPKVFDGAVNGIGTFLTSGAERSRRLQTGLVRSYAAVFLFGVVVIFAALLVRASFS
jgi:NADH-quinone oxidoreductase subunit L